MVMKSNKNINNVSEELKNKIIEAYKNNKSLRAIEKEFNITRQSVSKYLSEIGIKKTKGNHYRYYFHDFDYFENIDTEEKAYWLGFIYADGYIVNSRANNYGQRSFGLTLSVKDEKHLRLFKNSIRATNPITYYSKEKSKFCRLLLKSEKTVQDLIDKGCYVQKTKILRFPNYSQIPKELIHHFIRGYFDGDGSISISKDNRTNRDIYRVNIVGTNDMISGIIREIGFGYKIKEKRTDKIYYYSYDAIKNFDDLFNFLYKDSNIYLQRKYEKFVTFKNILKSRV